MKYNETFFWNSPTGRQIFALDDSNDAESRKAVPFGVSLILFAIYEVKSPKSYFLGVNRDLKLN